MTITLRHVSSLAMSTMSRSGPRHIPKAAISGVGAAFGMRAAKPLSALCGPEKWQRVARGALAAAFATGRLGGGAAANAAPLPAGSCALLAIVQVDREAQAEAGRRMEAFRHLKPAAATLTNPSPSPSPSRPASSRRRSRRSLPKPPSSPRLTERSTAAADQNRQLLESIAELEAIVSAVHAATRTERSTAAATGGTRCTDVAGTTAAAVRASSTSGGAAATTAATTQTSPAPAAGLPASEAPVRLPLPGSTLDEAVSTQSAVMGKIAEVQAELGAVQDCTPYPRSTTQHAAATSDGGVAEFSVLQFNVLAEGLSSGPDAPTPFAATRGSGYGGFTAVPHPETCLDFSKRKWLLLDEMIRSEADIITLQECDHWGDFFLPKMQLFGYAGEFRAKDDSPCLQFGYFSDGVAILYKESAWLPLAPAASDNFTAADGAKEGQVYLIQALEHRATGSRLTVGTTHLKAKCTAENEARRVHAIAQLLAVLEATAAAVPGGSAMLLAGDFNADAYTVTEKKETVVARCVPAVVATGLFDSAYPLPATEHDMYTTWKKRGAHEAKHTIDYVWHSKGSISTIATLDHVAEDAMEPARLPGFRFPSDHLSLLARLEFQHCESTA